ncbi:MAG: c-type cytochrome [Rhodocyclales bacterium]|nr:c-type cytochrome [Rhodocyclales bacterium]
MTQYSGKALVALILLAPVAALTADPSPGRSRDLVRMVRQDCGSCHGLTLKGGLGPPLLPETLREKPAESLRYTVLLGRPGTPMPPWNAFLTEAEADWIVRQLIAGFPEETR